MAPGPARVLALGCCLLTAATVLSCATPAQQPARLTPCPGTDGPVLVYSTRTDVDGTVDVFGITADNDVVQLTDDGLSGQPDYATDGSAILFVRRDEIEYIDDPAPLRGLWSMNPAGGEQQLIARVPDAGEPRWSPDRGRIALTASVAGGPRRISVLDADDRLVPVTTDTSLPDGYVVTHESHAVWSPDGTELAFVRTISKLMALLCSRSSSLIPIMAPSEP